MNYATHLYLHLTFLVIVNPAILDESDDIYQGYPIFFIVQKGSRLRKYILFYRPFIFAKTCSCIKMENPYIHVFSVISQLKDLNNGVLNAFSNITDDFSAKISQLLLQISKAKSELPNRRQKKLFSQTIGPIDFDNSAEIHKFWASISTDLVNKLPGLFELNESMKVMFSNDVKIILSKYNDSMSKLLKQYSGILSQYKEEEAKYNQAISDYQTLCKKIQQLHDQLQENPNQPSLENQLAQSKNSYKSTMTNADNASNSFDKVLSTFSLNAEKLLSDFETIDKELRNDLDNLFKKLQEAIKNCRQIQLDRSDKIEEVFKTYFNENTDSTYQKDESIPVKVDVYAHNLNFNFLEFIDMEKIFETELHNRMAVITSENASRPGEYNFPKGTTVEVLGVKGKNAKVIDRESKFGAIVDTAFLEFLPDDAPNQWKPAKLKEQHSTPHIDLTPDQPIIALKKNENEAYIIDQYGRKDVIALEKIEF